MWSKCPISLWEHVKSFYTHFVVIPTSYDMYYIIGRLQFCVRNMRLFENCMLGSKTGPFSYRKCTKHFIMALILLSSNFICWVEIHINDLPDIVCIWMMQASDVLRYVIHYTTCIRLPKVSFPNERTREWCQCCNVQF